MQQFHVMLFQATECLLDITIPLEDVRDVRSKIGMMPVSLDLDTHLPIPCMFRNQMHCWLVDFADLPYLKTPSMHPCLSEDAWTKVCHTVLRTHTLPQCLTSTVFWRSNAMQRSTTSEPVSFEDALGCGRQLLDQIGLGPLPEEP